MKRVLDSSVGFKWVVPELHSDKALRLSDDYRNGALELVAPDIFLVQVAHARTRAERQKRITPVQGALALADVMSTQPQLFGYIALLSPGLSDFVAHESRCLRLSLRGPGRTGRMRLGHLR